MLHLQMTQRVNKSPLSRTLPLKQKISPLSKTPEAFNSARFNNNRNNQDNQLLLKELNRIEEEYDLKILTKCDFYKDFQDDTQKKESVKISESFLEDVIFCLQFFENRIGRVLGKAWKTYLKSQNTGVSRKIEPDTAEVVVAKVNRMKNIGVQCENLEVVYYEEEYVKYIDMIRRALFKIDSMNHKKLVEELQKLLYNLSLRNDSSYSDSDSEKTEKKVEVVKKPPKVVEKVEFKVTQPTQKIIHHISPIEKTTQTDSEPKELISAETLKILLNDRDKTIYQLRESLSKYKNLEIIMKKKELEFKTTQGILKEIEDNGCSKCKERMEKLKIEMNQNLELKKHLQQAQNIEIELDSAKIMLQESAQVITKNSEKISEMNENLLEMEKKVKEIRKERKKLEQQLEKETRLRNETEKKLEKLEKSKQSRSLIRNKNSSKGRDSQINEKNSNFNEKSPSFNERNSIFNEKNSIFEEKNKSNESLNSLSIEKNLYTPTNYMDMSRNVDKLLMFPSSLTPERDLKNSSFLERPKSKILRETFAETQVTNEKIAMKARLIKNNNIFNILKISKEEYRMLSKQTRMELFEILFEHKEKCGNECEHLKKAYMIKERERGKLYPIKKLTIKAI